MIVKTKDTCTFNIVGESRIGGRSENQDSIAAIVTEHGLLAIVCDGMGGGPAGKTASSLAIQAITNFINSQKGKNNKRNLLGLAIKAAQKELLLAINKDSTLKGMGSTAVIALIDAHSACVAHVGDSRFYCLRKKTIAFKTTDHSLVANLVKEGKISEEQARTAPNSNVITQVIGIEGLCCPDIKEIPYSKGDRMALCSDGVWGAFPEPELLERLCSNPDPVQGLNSIMDAIDKLGENKACKYDNFSLILIDPSCSSTLRPATGFALLWKKFLTHFSQAAK